MIKAAIAGGENMVIVGQMKYLRLIAVLSLLGVVLAACAHQPPAAHGEDIPGFWHGLLHGFIAPLSLIGSFFDSTIRAYAFPNIGWWYDFGFVIGIGALLGGGASQHIFRVKMTA